jgi:hypothetical protein
MFDSDYTIHLTGGALRKERTSKERLDSLRRAPIDVLPVRVGSSLLFLGAGVGRNRPTVFGTWQEWSRPSNFNSEPE